MNFEEKYFFLKPGFWSWTGSGEISETMLAQTNLSLRLSWVIAMLIIFVIWIFKRQIHEAIKRKNVSVKTQEILIRTAGALTLTFIVARAIMFGVTQYPGKWETIPLHMCRILGISIGIVLLLNKPQWMKYLISLSFLGATIALILPDVKINYTPDETFTAFGKSYEKGKEYEFHIYYDNYIFYDLMALHVFILLSTFIVSIVFPYSIRNKDILRTLALFGSLVVACFFLNWALDDLAPSAWKSNYIYVGKDKYNPFSSLIGPLMKWPFNVFTLIGLGTLYLYACAGIFILQDKIIFNFGKGKKFLSFGKSSKQFLKPKFNVKKYDNLYVF
ncbi:YwaF family protein [Mycoplasma sp. 888]|uniref:YwaF family protein n=1 Tax=Mycoplasma sp. 888 TaxID=3108483 RepID=UPI002D799E73|nr:YwaF family protein [Mycoplasma sp. 888]WRQ25560.1 YwaF family protein [Mycoplasma sp. 888]